MHTAHRCVGAASIAAFLVLLLLIATHGEADPAVPAGRPVATPTVEPTQPAPSQTAPDPDGGFGRDRDGLRPRGGGGGGFGGGGGAPGGGGAAPAPSTGGGAQT
jgi:hypothetical protein